MGTVLYTWGTQTYVQTEHPHIKLKIKIIKSTVTMPLSQVTSYYRVVAFVFVGLRLKGRFLFSLPKT